MCNPVAESVLIAYSTVDGHTLHICQRMATVLQALGHRTTLHNIDAGGAIDPGRYARVVVGASIRYGSHRHAVEAFVRRHLEALRSRPNAFFSVNVVARKPGKDRADTNPYVRAFLRRVPWQPQCVDVFAGRLDYPRINPLDRWMIRLIMWITHGPTDPSGTYEFTDWDRVDDFARGVAGLLSKRPST